MVELTVSRQRAINRGTEYYSIPQTVARLGSLLSTMNLLHSHNIALGDLQYVNILITAPDTPPDVFLVDCDSFLLRGRWTLASGEAELMRPEELSLWPDVLDRRTDLYKFALIAVGCISKDASLIAVTDVVRSVLPAGHGYLLQRMMDISLEPPSLSHLRSVSKLWRGYWAGDGSEYIMSPRNLKRTPWIGDRSIPSPNNSATPSVASSLAASSRRSSDYSPRAGMSRHATGASSRQPHQVSAVQYWRAKVRGCRAAGTGPTGSAKSFGRARSSDETPQPTARGLRDKISTFRAIAFVLLILTIECAVYGVIVLLSAK